MLRPRLAALLPLAALLAAPAGAQAGLTPCANGTVTFGTRTYQCSGVDLYSALPLNTFSSPGTSTPSAANDIWGWTDPETDREYALMGLTNGTAFVDVTDPDTPVYLGKLPTATSNSTWRDVKVYADHAFIVSEASSHGMQVFDLRRLRGLAGPPQTFTANARYTGAGKAHNVFINEDTGFAYLVGANQSGFQCRAGGLHMVDIRDPQNPTFAGCFDSDGYTHDVQCVVYDGPDVDYQGKEICMASNEDTITIADVTDKAAPVLIARGLYPNPSYTHQGWFTEDKRYFLVDDETDTSVGGTRTLVMNVEDLDNPSLAFQHFGVVPTTDHNQYVLGRYSYQSNYEGGLRILDVSDLDNGQMPEVAFFDTYPQQNDGGYNGQWSNYPYFPSGTIVASDIQNGLFILKFNDPFATAGEPTVPQGSFALSNAAPNPFSGLTTVTATAGAATTLRAEVFDALGRRVAVLHDGALAAGSPLRLTFDGAGQPAGIYLLRVTTSDGHAETLRLTRTR